MPATTIYTRQMSYGFELLSSTGLPNPTHEGRQASCTREHCIHFASPADVLPKTHREGPHSTQHAQPCPCCAQTHGRALCHARVHWYMGKPYSHHCPHSCQHCFQPYACCGRTQGKPCHCQGYAQPATSGQRTMCIPYMRSTAHGRTTWYDLRGLLTLFSCTKDSWRASCTRDVMLIDCCARYANTTDRRSTSKCSMQSCHLVCSCCATQLLPDSKAHLWSRTKASLTRYRVFKGVDISGDLSPINALLASIRGVGRGAS